MLQPLTTAIGIWGWSYGGYLTAKTLETDSDAFSFGISTAPVSDWRFYDTMYTERYMKTLEMNEGGYNESAVREQAGFHHVRGSYLVQHGTGDDNVHFQHSAVLADTLMDAKVPPSKLQVQWFTDSTHAIAFGKDEFFLYRQLSRQVYTEKNREFADEKHQWNRRRVDF
jgi:dipeptidyl-peptidase-4